jgi:hypothetical protein
MPNSKDVTKSSEWMVQVLKVQNELEKLINMTPTGEQRNDLTTLNIGLMMVKEKSSH